MLHSFNFVCGMNFIKTLIFLRGSIKLSISFELFFTHLPIHRSSASKTSANPLPFFPFALDSSEDILKCQRFKLIPGISILDRPSFPIFQVNFNVKLSLQVGIFDNFQIFFRNFNALNIRYLNFQISKFLRFVMFRNSNVLE